MGDRLRIACVTTDLPIHRWFVNRLAAAHDVGPVVVEHGSSALEQLRRRPRPRTAVRLYGARWRRRRQARDASGARDRLLGTGWRAFDPALELVETRRAGDAAIRRRLETDRPDILFAFGCGILPPATLAVTAHAYNVHSGLAPWYRGLFTIQWALLRWDPHNIGVTLHAMTPAVDAGPILGQARPELEPGDTLLTIQCKLGRLACDLAGETCDALAAGHTPVLREQDPSLGTLYTAEQWGAALSRQIAHLQRRGALGRMLERPSASPRPGVRGVELAPRDRR